VLFVKRGMRASFVLGFNPMNPPEPNPEETILTFGEFLTGAVPTDSFQQVAEEIAQEQKNAILIDPNTRRDEEWSILANQIVGRENLRFI
jgi:hypothetical protein